MRMRALPTGVAAVAVTVVVAGLAVAGGWWLTRPTAFGDAGVTEGMTLDVGQGVLVNLWVVPSHQVELSDVDPVVSGTARADVRFHVCRPGPGGLAGMVYAERKTEFCHDEVPIGGASLGPIREGGRSLVATIVPRTSGRFVMDGVRVRYADGLQRGTQRTGSELRLTVR